MKKKTLVITICVVLAVLVLAFAACSENTKRDPVKTDLPANASIKSNGGMAVRYGDYVYFINGYAGETVDNTFGTPVRGSICRATIKNGEPDYTTVQTIVPKNVFGEDKTYGGIYIVNGYIYYNTTSVDKNSNREYKNTQGVLTRTSLDGSKTEVLKELNDNDIVLYAGDNSKYLVYSFDSYIYSVNSETNEIKLLTKSNAKNPTSEEQTAVAYKFAGDYAVFTMYNYADENNYSADYIVWAFNLKTGDLKEIASSDIYNGNTDRAVLYTTTVSDIIPSEDGFTMYYTKKGNDNGKLKDGYYSCTFSNKDMAYKAENEVRYTYGTDTTYSKFSRLSNGYTLAFSKQYFDVFASDGNKVYTAENKPMRLNFEKEVTLVSVEETDSEVFVYYVLDSKFYYVKLFDKNEGAFTQASDDAIYFFSGKYNSSYVSYDIIDNIIYYLNDDMEDNAYYYAFDVTKITKDTDRATGKILGIISEKDKVTLVTEEVSESK